MQVRWGSENIGVFMAVEAAHAVRLVSDLTFPLNVYQTENAPFENKIVKSIIRSHCAILSRPSRVGIIQPIIGHHLLLV